MSRAVDPQKPIVYLVFTPLFGGHSDYNFESLPSVPLAIITRADPAMPLDTSPQFIAVPGATFEKQCVAMLGVAEEIAWGCDAQLVVDVCENNDDCNAFVEIFNERHEVQVACSEVEEHEGPILRRVPVRPKIFVPNLN